MVPKQPLPDQNQGELLDISMPNNDMRNLKIAVLEDPALTDPTVEVLSATTETIQRTADLANRRERAGLLLAALTHISNERESRGYVRWDDTAQGNAEFTNRYEGSAPTVRAEKGYQSKVAPHKARDTFIRAFKLGLADHNAELEKHEIDDAFHDFHFKYASARNDKAKNNRRVLRTQLRRTLATTDEYAVPADTYTVRLQPEIVRTEKEELELLNSRQRMIALRDDKRAGFLPSNHNEKTQAFTLLTYLDHPKEHPGGVHEHLFAVAKHQERVYREQKGATHREAKDAGKEAVVSILNEYGDHIANAVQSITRLRKADQIIRETSNPAITLQEVIEDNPEVEVCFNELLRHVDLIKLRETGAAPMPFDPLGPKRNENPEVVREGQNKRLDDPYTGDVRSDAAKEYTEEQHSHVRVLTARKQLPEAIENEIISYQFWTGVLLSVRGPYKAEALKILDAVQPSSAA
jgi:hypothetical protein